MSISALIIYLDNIIFTLQKSGGISVVWYELLSRLMRSNHSIYYLNDENDNLFSKKLNFKNTNVIEIDNTCFPLLKRYLNPCIKLNYPFIFHSSYYRTCNNRNAINITTVHDFTYEYYECGIKKWIHSWQKNRAIRNSDYIICISENTKKDLLKFLPDIEEKKIRVIYNGVSDNYYQLSRKKQLDLPYDENEYILFVGARNDYKNFKLVVKAVAQTNLNLVVVGSPLNDKETQFVECSMGNSLRYYCTGRISNEELNTLYNYAYALLYPSAYEGFGIPVIEAQKSGCPVIAYNGSSIPEIIGKTPLLLQNLSVEEVCRCITLLENAKIREMVILDGLENAKHFTWDKMYNKVIALYEEAWNNKNNI